MKRYVLIFFIAFLSFFTSTVYALNPNDPRFISQWGLTKIQAQNAWSITTGSSSLIVAVIDDGIPSSTANHHEEFPSTKLVAGHDFFNDASGEDSDPSPEGQSWHGTHCAGIIGAATNNNLGIAGLCWNCKIMPLKVYNSIPNLMQESAWSKAIRYAVDNGAKIISMSIGFDGFSSSQIQDLKNAVTYAEQHDVLIITAAGNNGYNIDTHYVYPASFASTQSNLIAVAATNETDQILWNDTAKIYSNYGAQNVGLGAPGDRILSTVPLAVDSSGYAQAVGTSQATAFVAGVASLMKSKNPSLSAKNIKCKITKSADPISSLSGKTVSGGRLNAYSALTSSSYICDSSSTIKECDASADCNGKNPNDYTCINNNHVKRICDSNCKSSDICDNTKCPSSPECYGKAPGSNFCVSGYPFRIYCDSSCSASYICDNTCNSPGSAECNGRTFGEIFCTGNGIYGSCNYNCIFSGKCNTTKCNASPNCATPGVGCCNGCYFADLTGPTSWVPDGRIDMRDTSIEAAMVNIPSRYNVRGDFNKDGKIDMRDLSIVSQAYGKTCPVVSNLPAFTLPYILEINSPVISLIFEILIFCLLLAIIGILRRYKII